MLRGQRGKRQEAAAGANKGKQQPGGWQRIHHRIRQGKAKGHQGIKKKIEGDIEKAPGIG